MPDASLSLRVDQAIHGYQAGHRLLASSITLDDAAASALTRKSDLAVDPSRVEGSYLSGYPLKAANRYVLARTWLAPELPRPGCVWTHSLIVDYASLARLPDPGVLLNLFKRPRSGSNDWSGYQMATTVAPRESPNLSTPQLTSLLPALVSIYCGDGHADITSGGARNDEALAIALWRQMWPRLRRSFKFSSAVGADPNATDVEASLRFRTGFSEAQLLDSDWAELAPFVEDLPHIELTPLRRFLARYLIDVDDARRSAPAFAALQMDFDAIKKPKDLERALSLLSKIASPNDAQLLKSDLILGKIPNPMPSPHGDCFTFVVTALAQGPSPMALQDLAKRIHTVLSRSTINVGALVRGPAAREPGTLAYDLVSALAQNHPFARLSGIDEDDLRSILAARNPNLLSEKAFWPTAPADRRRLVRSALEQDLDWRILLEALYPTMDAEEVRLVAERGGDDAVEAILADLPLRPDLAIDGHLWGSVGRSRLEALQRGATGLIRRPDVLAKLCEAVWQQLDGRWLPDDVFNFGVPIWEAESSHEPPLVAACFLKGLALDTRYSADILKYSFEPLIDGFEHDSFSQPVLRSLDHALPTLGIFRDGDYWDRAVQALVRRYSSAGRPESWILTCTTNGDLLEEILRRLWYTNYGERLLIDLLYRVDRPSGEASPTAVRILKSIVGHRRRRK